MRSVALSPRRTPGAVSTIDEVRGRLTPPLARSYDSSCAPGIVRRRPTEGRGLPGNPPGDQYVVLEIVTPRADADRARALYGPMKQEMAFDARAHLGGQADAA